MSDILKILLQAEMDVGQSSSNIVRQIAGLQQKIDGRIKVDLDINTKDASKAIEGMSEKVGALGATNAKVWVDSNNQAHKYSQTMQDVGKSVKEVSTFVRDADGAWTKMGSTITHNIGKAIQDASKETERLKKSISKDLWGQSKEILEGRIKTPDALKDMAKYYNKIGKEAELAAKEAENLNKQISKSLWGQSKDILADRVRTPDPLKDMAKYYTEMEREASRASATTDGLGSSLQSAASKALGFVSATAIFYKFVRELKNGIDIITEVDSAMVELKKVTNATEQEYVSFMSTAFEMGSTLSRTGLEVIQATADFARMGFEMQTASKLAYEGLLMLNVGDGIRNLDHATSSIISTLKGFKTEAGDVISTARHMNDAFNEVANNFAVDTGALAEGTRRISAVMVQAGNDLDQTIGMITGAFEVLQDEKKTSSGLNIIAQRLKAIDEEGNPILGLAPKLKKEFASIGIALEDTNGEMKSTYQILGELAEIFPTLTQHQQNYISELTSGKRQSVVLQSLMSNWQAVEEATRTATNSMGSALIENEKYLDSIEGKMQNFSSATQDFWRNAIDSQSIKDLVDSGTEVVRIATSIVESFGGVNSVLLILVPLIGVKLVGALKAATAASIAKKLATGELSSENLTLGKALQAVIGGMFSYETATKGAATATSLLSGATLGLHVALIAIPALITAIKVAEEKRKIAMEETVDAYKKQKDVADAFSDLSVAYEDLAEKTDRTTEENERFASIKSKLIDLIPQSKNVIDNENLSLEEQSKLLQSLNEDQLELAKSKALEVLNQGTSVDVLAKDIERYQHDIDALNEKISVYQKKQAEGIILNKLESSSLRSLKGSKEDLEKKMGRVVDIYDEKIAATEILSGANDELAESVEKAKETMLDLGDKSSWTTESIDGATYAVDKFDNKIQLATDSTGDLMYDLDGVALAADNVNDAFFNADGTVNDYAYTISTLYEEMKETQAETLLLESALDELKDTGHLTTATYEELVEASLDFINIMGMEQGEASNLLSSRINLNNRTIDGVIAEQSAIVQATRAKMDAYSAEISALSALAAAKAAAGQAFSQAQGGIGMPAGAGHRNAGGSALFDEGSGKVVSKNSGYSSNEVANIANEIKKQEAILNSLKGFKVAGVNASKAASSDRAKKREAANKKKKQGAKKKKKELEKKLAEASGYEYINIQIEKNNALLAKNKALQDKANDGTIEKVRLIQEQIKLEKNHQKLLGDKLKVHERDRNQQEAILRKNGFKFKGQGDSREITNLHNIAGKKKEVEEAFNKFNELQFKTIPGLQVEIMEMANAIESALSKGFTQQMRIDNNVKENDHLLTLNRINQEREKDVNKRVLLMKEEVKLIEHKAYLSRGQANLARDERKEIEKTLKTQGFKFEGEGDKRRIVNPEKLKGQVKEVEELFNKYNEIQIDVLPNLVIDAESFKDDIKKVEDLKVSVVIDAKLEAYDEEIERLNKKAERSAENNKSKQRQDDPYWDIVATKGELEAAEEKRLYQYNKAWELLNEAKDLKFKGDIENHDKLMQKSDEYFKAARDGELSVYELKEKMHKAEMGYVDKEIDATRKSQEDAKHELNMLDDKDLDRRLLLTQQIALEEQKANLTLIKTIDELKTKLGSVSFNSDEWHVLNDSVAEYETKLKESNLVIKEMADNLAKLKVDHLTQDFDKLKSLTKNMLDFIGINDNESSKAIKEYLLNTVGKALNKEINVLNNSIDEVKLKIATETNPEKLRALEAELAALTGKRHEVRVEIVETSREAMNRVNAYNNALKETVKSEKDLEKVREEARLRKHLENADVGLQAILDEIDLISHQIDLIEDGKSMENIDISYDLIPKIDYKTPDQAADEAVNAAQESAAEVITDIDRILEMIDNATLNVHKRIESIKGNLKVDIFDAETFGKINTENVGDYLDSIRQVESAVDEAYKSADALEKQIRDMGAAAELPENIINDLVLTAKGSLQGYIEGLESYVDEVTESLGKNLTNGISAGLEAFESAVSSAKNKVVEGLQFSQEDVQNSVQSIHDYGSALERAIGETQSRVKELEEKLKSDGLNAIEKAELKTLKKMEVDLVSDFKINKEDFNNTLQTALEGIGEKDLSEIKIELSPNDKMDEAKFNSAMDGINQQLKDAGIDPIEIEFKEGETVEELLERVKGLVKDTDLELKVEVDLSTFEKEIKDAVKKAQDENVTVLKVDGDTAEAIKQVEDFLNTYDGSPVTLNVEAPTASAVSEIQSLFDKYNGASIKLNVSADTSSIPRNAKGTDNFAGGLSIVSELGRELIVTPDGRISLTGNKGSELMNIEEGSTVIPNDKTERILKGLGIPAYANGTKNPYEYDNDYHKKGNVAYINPENGNTSVTGNGVWEGKTDDYYTSKGYIKVTDPDTVRDIQNGALATSGFDKTSQWEDMMAGNASIVGGIKPPTASEREAAAKRLKEFEQYQADQKKNAGAGGVYISTSDGGYFKEGSAEHRAYQAEQAAKRKQDSINNSFGNNGSNHQSGGNNSSGNHNPNYNTPPTSPYVEKSQKQGAYDLAWLDTIRGSISGTSDSQSELDLLELKKKLYQEVITAGTDIIEELYAELELDSEGRVVDTDSNKQIADKINNIIKSQQSAQKLIKDTTKEIYEQGFKTVDKQIEALDKLQASNNIQLEIARELDSSDFDSFIKVGASSLQAERDKQKVLKESSVELEKQLEALEEGSFEWNIVSDRLEQVNSSIQDSTLEIIKQNKELKSNKRAQVFDDLEKRIYSSVKSIRKLNHEMALLYEDKRPESLELMELKLKELKTQADEANDSLLDMANAITGVNLGGLGDEFVSNLLLSLKDESYSPEGLSKEELEDIDALIDKIRESEIAVADLQKSIEQFRVDKVFKDLDSSTRGVLHQFEMLNLEMSLVGENDFARRFEILGKQQDLTSEKILAQKQAHLELRNVINKNASERGFITEEELKQLDQIERETKQTEIEIQGIIKQRYELKFRMMDEKLARQDEIQDSYRKQLEIMKELDANNYDGFINANESLINSEEKKLNTLKESSKQLQEQLKAVKEGSTEWELINNRLTGVNSSIQDSTLEIIRLNKEVLRNKYEQRLKEEELKLFDGQTQEEATKQFEKEVKEQDKYMEGLERELTVSKLIKQARIDEIELTKEELALLNDGDKLEKSKLERLEHQLKVRVAEQRLQNIQNQKTVKQLKKQADGTFAFEYVADQKSINQAEIELKEAKLDLLNWEKNLDREKRREEIEKKGEYLDELRKLTEKSLASEIKSMEEFYKDSQKIRDEFLGEIDESVETTLESLGDSFDGFLSRLEDFKASIENFRQPAIDNVDYNDISGGSKVLSKIPRFDLSGVNIDKIIKSVQRDVIKEIGFVKPVMPTIPRPVDVIRTEDNSVHVDRVEFPNANDVKEIQDAILGLRERGKQKMR